MHNPVRPVIVEDANAQLAARVFGKPSVPGLRGASGTNGNSTLVYQDGTAPAGNTVANTTAETAITSTYTFPASTLKVGSVIRVKLFGLYSTALIAPTLTGKIKLGATTVLNTGALTAVAGVTNAGWSTEALLIVTAIGASGTVECQGYAEFATAATTALSANVTNTAAISIDTTAAQSLTVALKWSAASASNTITVRQMVVELEDVGAPSTTGGGSNSGRLTLTSGVPVAPADVTGATTIYFTPYQGNQIQLWNGSAWVTYTFAEASLALGTMTSLLCYDVFAYQSGGTLSLEKLAWASATARATAVTLQDGRYCKSGDKTRLYLGTFLAESTTTTSDTLQSRLVWNNYNRVPRPLRRVDTTDQWTYSIEAYRQAGANPANVISVVIGLNDVFVDLSVSHIFTTANAIVGYTGIGLNSTTVNSATIKVPAVMLTSSIATPRAHIQDSSLGYMPYYWLEKSGPTAGVTTWYGDAGTTDYQTGMVGMLSGG